MKPLPMKLRKNGFDYTLLHREGDVAIYEQGVCGISYFEVIIIKAKPEHLFKGQMREAQEIFPCNEGIGRTAWSKRTLAEAIFKFKELVAKRKKGAV